MLFCYTFNANKEIFEFYYFCKDRSDRSMLVGIIL